MSRMSPDPDRLAELPLEFDPASGDLTGPSDTVRLAPQPAALLSLLRSHAGSVVTRDTIRDHLWPGGKVEFEQGIAFAVREVRKAIAAAGGDPEALETIPKRGFRLRWVGSASEPLGGDDATRAALVPGVRGQVRAVIGAIAVFAVIAALAVSTLRSVSALPVIGVFPHDVVGGPFDASLGQQLGFRVTAALTESFADRLGVVGPTGTGVLVRPSDADSIGLELGACLVLSGQIVLLGSDSASVFTQIVRTSDQVHVWATFDTVPRSDLGGRVVDGITEGVRSSLSEC